MFEHPEKTKANRYAVGYVLVTLAVIVVLMLASCEPATYPWCPGPDAPGFVPGAAEGHQVQPAGTSGYYGCRT